MDLRNTKIRVSSSEQSKQFQEAVFAAGGCWLNGERVVKDTELPYLQVTSTLYMSTIDTTHAYRFERNPSPDITEDFFGISDKPLKIENPVVGDKIYHIKDSQMSLHTILHIGEQVALIRSENGCESAVGSCFTGWQRFDAFPLLKVDDPVWVRDNLVEEWVPRHYAEDRQVFAFGRTSHTEAVQAPLYSYKFWKHAAFGEWVNHKY